MSPSDQPGAQGRANRLAGEISPYLLLHAHNPVDWYPWGPEALDKARDENKPIFLSVGYSTCYWCHVMERESFSDAGTAKLMNEHFVNVKVDREERPELDEIYMAATQLYSQQGGWPNSVFLTPELKPFFAGTYFPPRDLHGRPSFKTVLLSMHNAWTTRRDEVQEQADALADAMRRYLEERGEPAERVAPASAAGRSLESLASRFDEVHGGFGGAPKFPSPGNLYLLLDFAEETRAEDAEGTKDVERAAHMLEATLDAMGRGGLYDQLAGGFHRYATDGEWKIPHFEKMLYDNAHLLEIYARDYARTGSEERARIVRETARFLENELTSEEGGFLSAIDAEVAGKEGAHHVWTREEIVEVLGEEDAGFLAPVLGFAGEPFFEGEHYVLHLPESYETQAERRQMSRRELLEQVRPLLEKLLAARRERDMPLVDDKILADWNGMAIRGLARAGDLLGDPWMVDLAAGAARFVLRELRDDDGRLLHSWRQGEARYRAYLADYVFLVRGLLALHDATGDDEWLDEAERLTEEQIERLEDETNGGFFTSGEEPDVLFRSKEVFDGALPSANAVAALNLLDLASEKGPERWLPLAEKTLRAFTLYVEKQPEGARMLSLAARRYQRMAGGPIGPEAEAEATALNLAESAARKLVDAELEVLEKEDAVEQGDADSWRPFRLALRVRDGWHLYAPDPGDENLVPTTVEGVETELRGVEWPAAETMELAGVEARVLSGEVEVCGELRGADPRLRLRYQPCDEARCLAVVSVDLSPR